MSEDTYYQRNKEVIKQRVKNYYENNKEILRERGKNKYRELSEEKKCKEAVPKKNRYRDISDEKKRKLKEYHKNYREARRATKIIDILLSS